MSAGSAIGGAAVTSVNHSTVPNATQNLQQIQQRAIAEHNLGTPAASKSGVDIKAYNFFTHRIDLDL